ncbi:MAG: DSD1 family PLP-dependent enzyme [Proteobacteria bacterium]|nr:DSD1 family PLP-dependent enzyme [Pseudomonadota bacterium]
MKRRSLLVGGAGIALAAGGAGVLWRPDDMGAPHNDYFSNLNSLLKRDGPGRPVMLIDTERMNTNIDLIVNSVGREKIYRVVVKSLPSVPLLEQVMRRARTTSLMVFHQPFLNAIAEAFPESDTLLGKPMPLAAAATFYKKLGNTKYDAANQVQWLIDTPKRLQQYQALARQLGIKMRINFEIDVGLHRGGLPEPDALAPLLSSIGKDPEHLQFTGLMGYEPHLTGLQASLAHPAVRQVLDIFKGFIDQAKTAGFDAEKLTLNGAGSHTLGIYHRDKTMNDLSAGSGVVKPTDFDTYHLNENLPALFIATPILKRYDELKIPGDPALAKLLPLWNPNMRRLYYIYGGYWKARVVSPPGVADPIYQSTNQSPITTSTAVDLEVDDYMFLRPTQSEHVMLQFGDLYPFKGDQLLDTWPIFHQTG